MARPRDPITTTHPLFRKLCEAADASNLRIDDLAKATGHSKHTFSRMRKPSFNPRLRTVEDLCDFFNLTLTIMEKPNVRPNKRG